MRLAPLGIPGNDLDFRDALQPVGRAADDELAAQALEREPFRQRRAVREPRFQKHDRLRIGMRERVPRDEQGSAAVAEKLHIGNAAIDEQALAGADELAQIVQVAHADDSGLRWQEPLDREAGSGRFVRLARDQAAIRP
ncbi:MAG: hypothetical protein E6H57_00230, partial [Betaproteobacteria bacterium]